MLSSAEAIERLAQLWLPLSDFDFGVEHWAGIKYQAASVLLWLPTEEADHKTQKDELPAFMVDQPGTMTDNENNTFALDPDVVTFLKSVTLANKTGLTTPALAEFIKAQVDDAFCLTAEKGLGNAETENTINKE